MGAPCTKHRTAENSTGFLSPTLPCIALLAHWNETYAPLPLVGTSSSRFQFVLVQLMELRLLFVLANMIIV